MSNGLSPPTLEPGATAPTLRAGHHLPKNNDYWWRPLKEAGPRIIKSLTAIAVHTIVGAAILVSIFALHYLTTILGIESGVITKLFVGADAGVIVVFMIGSAIEFWKAMRD